MTMRQNLAMVAMGAFLVPTIAMGQEMVRYTIQFPNAIQYSGNIRELVASMNKSETLIEPVYSSTSQRCLSGITYSAQKGPLESLANSIIKGELEEIALVSEKCPPEYASKN